MVHVCDTVFRMKLLVSQFNKAALSEETKGLCNTWLTALCGFHSEKHIAYTAVSTQSAFLQGVEHLVETVQFSSDDDKLKCARVESASWSGLGGDDGVSQPLSKVKLLWFGKFSVGFLFALKKYPFIYILTARMVLTKNKG